jgi:putative peptidoglycan lipid II flippase
LGRNVSVLAGATLASRVLGYARDLVVAFTLGASPLADAFFVAFRLPNLLRRLFGEGALTMAFVPVFCAARRERGEAAAFAMARAAGFWLLVVLGAACALAVLFPEPLVLLVAPGFAKDPALLARAAAMARICFPYALCICGVALCMGVLNSMGRFLAPALAPVVLNLCLIAGALGAWRAGYDVALALCWSVLAAGVLQWVLQQPFLRAAGFSWRGPWRPADRHAREAGRLLLPTLAGAAAFQTAVLLGTVMASLLERGAVAHLYYADRLVQLPLGVFAVAVGTAALPDLSALAAAGRTDGFLRTVDQALGLALFLNLPAAAGLAALAGPIVALLFERGAFGAADATATAQALAAFAAGLPALAATRPLAAAFYARRRVRPPVVAAVASLAIFAACGALLMGPLGHVGIALAVSASAWANALCLARALRRELGPWFRAGGRVAAMAGLSLAVGAAALWSLRWGPGAAVGCIPLWALLYLGAAHALGLREARDALAALRRTR